MAVVEQEVKRQVALIEDGGKVGAGKPGSTIRTATKPARRARKMRTITATFPDPDPAAPIELDDAFLEECRASLPQLPDAKRHRCTTKPRSASRPATRAC
jgi:aspartyl-tRNA(Asn)/glutamyl-tRNA(Gln) amidotransferase subunit B